jgi:hypothetical protein
MALEPFQMTAAAASRGLSRQGQVLVLSIDASQPQRQSARVRGLGRQRWVVERGYAHLHNFRRLRTRYERDPRTGLVDLPGRVQLHQELLVKRLPPPRRPSARGAAVASTSLQADSRTRAAKSSQVIPVCSTCPLSAKPVVDRLATRGSDDDAHAPGSSARSPPQLVSDLKSRGQLHDLESWGAL